MPLTDTRSVKRRVAELGADLCGIAPVNRFEDAPKGFQPTDVIAECRCVIVLAVRFPVSALSSPSAAVYTFVRHQLVKKMDAITSRFAAEFEDSGCTAVPIASSDPYDYWDDSRMHGQGVLSLKHAAVRAEPVPRIAVFAWIPALPRRSTV